MILREAEHWFTEVESLYNPIEAAVSYEELCFAMIEDLLLWYFRPKHDIAHRQHIFH